MRKLIVLALAAMFCLPATSQTRTAHPRPYRSDRDHSRNTGREGRLYRGEASFGFGIDGTSSQWLMLNMDFINGAQVHPNVMVGGGIGWHFFPGDFSVFPLYASAQFKVFDHGSTPFFHLDLGYGFVASEWDEEKGGAYVATGIGFDLRTRAGRSFRIGLDYQLHQIRYSDEYFSPHYYGCIVYEQENELLHMVALKVGFAF